MYSGHRVRQDIQRQAHFLELSTPSHPRWWFLHSHNTEEGDWQCNAARETRWEKRWQVRREGGREGLGKSAIHPGPAHDTLHCISSELCFQDLWAHSHTGIWSIEGTGEVGNTARIWHLYPQEQEEWPALLSYEFAMHLHFLQCLSAKNFHKIGSSKSIFLSFRMDVSHEMKDKTVLKFTCI